MDSKDPSGIVYDPNSDIRLADSIYNNSNGSITLTFERANGPNHPLIVKLVEFNSIYYISIGGHILALDTFYSFKSAQDTSQGLSVSYGDTTHITYKQISATQFMTIMSALEDTITDADIYIHTATAEPTAEPAISEAEESSILDNIIPPPNPDTLHSPNSNPMTRSDQVAFLVGILAFLIAILHSVYLAVNATIKLV
jgi:hypothetical protein